MHIDSYSGHILLSFSVYCQVSLIFSNIFHIIVFVLLNSGSHISEKNYSN